MTTQTLDTVSSQSGSSDTLSASTDTDLNSSRVLYAISQVELADTLGVAPQAVSIQASKLEIEPKRIGPRAYFDSRSARRLLAARGYRYPQATLSFHMLKGGSTKTSTAFNLAVRLNQYGARVLAVDLDMQGNFTDAFGVSGDGPVFNHVANGECSIEEAIVNVSDQLDLLPSSFENSTLDFLITSRHSDLRRYISGYLAPIKDRYDFIIIDCNPALSALNISIALASDRVIIPVNPDRFAAKGLQKTVEELEKVGREFDRKIPHNLLFTMYDAREGASARYLIDYGRTYGDRLIENTIRRNADVKNAFDQKKCIFDFPKASAREDFDLLARDFFLGWARTDTNARSVA